MQKKVNYLTKHDFETLLKGSHRVVYNKAGTLKYTEGSGKISIVIGSKTEKRAVYRNKIKRRARTLFKAKKGVIDASFYPAKQVTLFEYKQYKEFFDELLKKAI